MKLLMIDIETTGFSRQWDYIIELAAVLYDTETDEELDRFHEYIKPGKKIPDKITMITGITNYQVENCRSEDDVVRDFIEWVAIVKPDATGGHNIDTFDLQFIEEKANKYFITYKKPAKTIDTLKLARKIKPAVGMSTATGRPSYKMESIAMGMGHEYNAHSAIDDVITNYIVYKHLLATEERKNGKSRKKLGF